MPPGFVKVINLKDLEPSDNIIYHFAWGMFDNIKHIEGKILRNPFMPGMEDMVLIELTKFLTWFIKEKIMLFSQF